MCFVHEQNESKTLSIYHSIAFLDALICFSKSNVITAMVFIVKANSISLCLMFIVQMEYDAWPKYIEKWIRKSKNNSIEFT